MRIIHLSIHAAGSLSFSMTVLAYCVLAFLLFGGRVPSVILGLPIGMIAGILSMPFPFGKRSTVQGALGGMGVTLALYGLVCWAFHTLGMASTWKPLLFTSACLVIPFLMKNAYIKLLNEELESTSCYEQAFHEKLQNLKTLRGWRVGEVVGVVLLIAFTFQR